MKTSLAIINYLAGLAFFALSAGADGSAFWLLVFSGIGMTAAGAVWTANRIQFGPDL